MSAALHASVGVQPCTAAEICAAAGISRRMFFLAQRLRREGCPELFDMVLNGKASLNLAVSLVDMFPNHDDQRRVTAEFHDLPARQWLGFASRVHELTKGGA